MRFIYRCQQCGARITALLNSCFIPVEWEQIDNCSCLDRAPPGSEVTAVETTESPPPFDRRALPV